MFTTSSAKKIRLQTSSFTYIQSIYTRATLCIFGIDIDHIKCVRRVLGITSSCCIGSIKELQRREIPENQTFECSIPRPGSVVAERSPGMREVGGSIPGRVKQKTLKFEVLLLCLALSTKELETVWPARSQNNGLGWEITAYPWGGVSVG